jgi:hypothetical protein
LSMSNEVLPPEEFSEIALWKMEQRKRDMEDIASGRRTPEEVERDNSWLIPYPEECVKQPPIVVETNFT